MKHRHDRLLLLYTLPSKSSSRVSLWRQLKKSGAIALNTSTYVLPDEPPHRERFQCRRRPERLAARFEKIWQIDFFHAPQAEEARRQLALARALHAKRRPEIDRASSAWQSFEMIHLANLDDGKFARVEPMGIDRVLQGSGRLGFRDEALSAKGGECFDALYEFQRRKS